MIRYYSPLRPFGTGTYPRQDGRETITNFTEGRIFCEEIGREAWGYIEYPEPITDKDARSYDLIKAGSDGRVIVGTTTSGETIAALIDAEPIVMLADDDRKTADRFGFTPQLEKLTRELLRIDGVAEIEYDLDGFWSDIRHVIILAKYDIPVADSAYYAKRRIMLNNILEVCAQNGLRRTGDTIEDYGEHYYIVTRCTWPVVEAVQ